MDADKKILLDLFTGSLRFVVPVYQRRYSWGEAQCRQLWADIVTAGRHPDRTHFIGSICFASMFVRQVRQCFSVVWADGFPRCRHRFPVM